jgi:hypothetical protein
VIGEDKKMGGFVYEGLYPKNSFLEKGFGGDQFKKVFGFCFAAEGPETFATATSHDEEKERGWHRKSLCESLGGGKFEIWG